MHVCTHLSILMLRTHKVSTNSVPWAHITSCNIAMINTALNECICIDNKHFFHLEVSWDSVSTIQWNTPVPVSENIHTVHSFLQCASIKTTGIASFNISP